MGKSRGGQVRDAATTLGTGERGVGEDAVGGRQRYSEELLKDTAEYWGTRGGREFSREAARQILENLTGFFGILMEWDARSKDGGGGTGGTKSPIGIADDGREAGTGPVS